jgi:hypothetical protein
VVTRLGPPSGLSPHLRDLASCQDRVLSAYGPEPGQGSFAHGDHGSGHLRSVKGPPEVYPRYICPLTCKYSAGKREPAIGAVVMSAQPGSPQVPGLCGRYRLQLRDLLFHDRTEVPWPSAQQLTQAASDTLETAALSSFVPRYRTPATVRSAAASYSYLVSDDSHGISGTLEYLARAARGHDNQLKRSEVAQLKADLMNVPTRWLEVSVSEIADRCRTLGMRDEDVATVVDLVKRAQRLPLPVPGEITLSAPSGSQGAAILS